MLVVTSKKVFEMLKIFEVLPQKVLENRKNFNMAVAQVCTKHTEKYSYHKRHDCGTVHCFAGWFFIAKHFSEIRDGRFVSGDHARKDNVSYTSGVKALNEHFFPEDDRRFSDNYDLAHNLFAVFSDDDIWGNSNQAHMVSNRFAFTPRNKKRADTLQDVLDHWCEVGLRLYIRELFYEGEKE